MIDRLMYGAAAAALVLAACEQQPATSPAPEESTMSETETATPDEAPAADGTVEPAAEGGALAALENNPFAEEWTENFGAPPLDRITEAHFMPLESSLIFLPALAARPKRSSEADARRLASAAGTPFSLANRAITCSAVILR